MTEQDFSPEETQAYLEYKGNVCPKEGCDGTDFEANSKLQMDGDYAWKDYRCKKCGTEFRDIYGLTGVVQLV